MGSTAGMSSKLVDRLAAEARGLGFDRLGVCGPVPSPRASDAYRRWLASGMAGEMAYLSRPDRVARALDPCGSLPSARSMVVVGVDYSRADLAPEVRADPSRGLIAAYAQGADYHDAILPRLAALAERAQRQEESSKTDRLLGLVEEFPEQPFVLDHIAKPAIRDGLFSPWQEDLERLAGFPNVFCKLSGMVTEAKWKQWQPEDFHRYLDIVIEAFGTDRVMIGSDWPVCTLSGDYVSTMRVVAEYVQQFSAKIRDDILGNNCARFYHIETNTTPP